MLSFHGTCLTCDIDVYTHGVRSDRYLIHRKDDSRKVRLVQGTMHVRLVHVDEQGTPIEPPDPVDGKTFSPTAAQSAARRLSAMSPLSSLRSLKTLSPQDFPVELVPLHVQDAAAKNPALLQRVRAAVLPRRLRPSRGIRRFAGDMRPVPMPLVDDVDAPASPLHRFNSLTAGATVLAARARGQGSPIETAAVSPTVDSLRGGSPSSSNLAVANFASRLTGHVRSSSSGRLRLPVVQVADSLPPTVTSPRAAFAASTASAPVPSLRPNPLFDFATASSRTRSNGDANMFDLRTVATAASSSPRSSGMNAASVVNAPLQPSRLYRGRSTAAGNTL
jgi:hypothetical protein